MDNLEQRGLDATNRHNRIVQYCKDASMMFLGLGKELYFMFHEQQYIDLGYPSFESYIGSPEVTVSISTAKKAKAIYKKFIIELGIVPERLAVIGVKKLDLIAEKTTEKNVKHMLVEAEILSYSDLRLNTVPEQHSEPLRGYWVAYRHFYRELQNLRDTHPELKDEILLAVDVLEDLKEKL